MFQNPVLEESALSSYRTYIRAAGHSKVQHFALHRLIIVVVHELQFSLGRKPTVNEVRELELKVICQVELEFCGQSVPPRPHGL